MLDKAIKSGKEHRKPYRGAKAVDAQCRNHGTCTYCSRARQFNKLKTREFAKLEVEEYEKDLR